MICTLGGGCMPEREPVSAENCTSQYEDNQLQAADPGLVIPWSEARHRLEDNDGFYWFTTIRPSGQPHVRPVLAVWVDGVLCSTSNRSTRKGRNLSGSTRCTVAMARDGIDLVVEGTAGWVDDEALLQRIAEAYHSKYGWPVTIRGGAFDAPYGAPSAGPPPYHPYAVTPKVVYGFGTNEHFGPRSTRWRFE
jgi:Pyridoxamine 5'-phosphate oxidase